MNPRFVNAAQREAGESDAQALIRECREELSVELKPASLRPYGVFRAQAHGRTLTELCEPFLHLDLNYSLKTVRRSPPRLTVRT